MTKAGTIWLMFLALVLLTTGCRSLLPTDDTRTLNQWQNFDEAQASFDKIMPHQTTAEELFKMGWDPETTPNVKILTYLDLIERDRKSTRLNSSHITISYAVFCLKKKKKASKEVVQSI